MATFGTPWRWGIVTASAGAVCGVALCLVVIAHAEGCPGWAILLGLTAFLFNPLLPIRMRRADWRLLNIGATVLLTTAAVRFGRVRPR